MQMKKMIKTMTRIFGSRQFFWAVLAIFGFQAAWIALTGRYPQAFDEQYHFGVIQLHAQQWSPFFASQPVGADQYGALVRDPSVLYHYLLSFPYRLLNLFVHSETTQIIVFRFINIGFIVWALFLFRRLLRLVGLSSATAQLTILFITLLPVFPLLAAQLNYDNLLIPVTALTLIWTVEVYTAYHRTGQLDWLALVRLLIAMTVFSTIKFAFTPVLFAVVLLFLPVVWSLRGKVVHQVRASFGALRLRAKLAYVVAACLALWLFGGGIGLNVVRYHATTPRCNDVLTVKQCMEFGPFARDYKSVQVRRDHASASQLAWYVWAWTKNMMRETFFTVYSLFNSRGKVDYYGGKKISQLMVMGWIWFWFSLAVFVISLRWLWSRAATRVLLLVSLVYTASLFFVDIKLFYHTTYVAAVHGRYLFPVLIALMACVVLAIGYQISRLSAGKQVVARSVAVLAIILTLIGWTQGGGMLTYIYYSSDAAFWQQSQFAQDANRVLRDGLYTVIVQ